MLWDKSTREMSDCGGLLRLMTCGKCLVKKGKAAKAEMPHEFLKREAPQKKLPWCFWIKLPGITSSVVWKKKGQWEEEEGETEKPFQLGEMYDG